MRTVYKFPEPKFQRQKRPQCISVEHRVDGLVLMKQIFDESFPDIAALVRAWRLQHVARELPQAPVRLHPHRHGDSKTVLLFLNYLDGQQVAEGLLKQVTFIEALHLQTRRNY